MENYSLDKLAEELFNEINKDKDFFRTKIVIVPSVKTNSYLKAFHMKNHASSILMNVKFLTFNKAMLELIDTDYQIANQEQITSIIIDILKKNDIDELKKYLDCKKTNEEGKEETNENLKGIKIYDVAKNLAKLFRKFEENAIDFEAETSDWKINIYNQVLKRLEAEKLTTINYLYRQIKNNKINFKNQETIYVFGFIKDNLFFKDKDKNDNPVLNKKLLDEYKNYVSFDLILGDNNSELFLAKAPNKLREIENLHTNICRILLEDKDKKINFSDFMVVGTNISEYEGEIERTFNQDDEKKDSSKISLPNIPYYINAPKIRNNSIYNALVILNDIICNGFYTRLDFDNLINNRAIRNVRGISDQDIDNWRNAIINMKSYRNEDWEYVKNRMLVSKICNLYNDQSDDSESEYKDEYNIVSLEGKDYIAYSRIGLDDDSIYKFCKMVDDLNDLIRIKNDSLISNIDDLNNIKNSLDKLLSKKDENDIESNGYYKKIYDVFVFWENNNIFEVPTSTLLNMLIDVSQNTSTNQGELYTSGVSFTEFDSNTVLSAKYVFFINASSSNLPIKKTRNPFDDEEVNYNKEKNAFKLWYQNANKIYVSFVSRDLKKDEEFFLSNFVKELDNSTINAVKNKDNNGIFEEKNIDEKIDRHLFSIGIDETRPKSYIFTARGRKNKEYLEGIIEGSGQPIDEIKDKKPNTANEVTTSELGNFLDEPLSAKAKRLFGSSEDIEENIEKEYEPFDLDGLESYNIFVEIAQKILTIDENDIESKKSDIIKSFNLRNMLPKITDEIKKKALDGVIDDVLVLKKKISSKGNFEIVDDLKELNIGGKFNLINNKIFIRIVKDNERIYYPIKNIKKLKDKDILTLYIISLMDVANIQDTSTHKISLCPNILNKTQSKIIISFDIEKNSAIVKLVEIYNKYMSYEDNKYFGFNLFEKEENPDDNSKEENNKSKKLKQEKSKTKKLKEKIYDFVDNLDLNDNWRQFNENKLFDKSSELGYEEEDFMDNLGEMENEQRKLILCINQKEDEQDGE